MRRLLIHLLFFVNLLLHTGTLKADSIDVNHYFELADKVKAHHPDSALKLYDKALTLCTENQDFYSMVLVHINVARVCIKNDQLQKALANLLNAKSLAQTYDDPLLNYSVLHEMISCYLNMYKYKLALSNSVAGIELASKTYNDSIKMCSQIQWLYSYYLEYQMDSAQRIFQIIQDIEKVNSIKKSEYFSSLISSFLSNFYVVNQEFDKAIICNKKSLEYYERIKDSVKIATSFRGLGNIYYELNDLARSIEFYEKAFSVASNSGNFNSASCSAADMAYIYGVKSNRSDLERFSTLAEELCAKTTSLSDDNYVFTWLGEIHKKVGNVNKALYYNEKLNNVKDLLIVNNSADELLKLESELTSNYNLSVQKKEFERQEQIKEGERLYQKKLRNIALFGLFVVAVFLFFVYRSYIQKKKDNILITKQKEEAQEQKMLIEEQNREITDSISYAKRLQEGILPAIDYVKKHIANSFILYKPKNIVAGDFYWVEHKKDWTYVAAADCTGHGVPGAMVSVICSNALNRSVNSFKKSLPGEILDKTRELVLQTFTKSAAEIKDGMDISLLAINNNTNELMWSGANNPLWYISKGELKEIKADKQPVGFNDQSKPFTTHSLQFNKGDVVYLFSDGFADQFGGPKGKKFKSSQLKEVLLSVHSKSIDEQSELLNDVFMNWKGDLEQIDDVLMIGICL